MGWANEVSAERTELVVYEFNEQARAFWESMGFVTVYRRMSKNVDEPR